MRWSGDAHLCRHGGTLHGLGLFVGHVPGFPGAHSQGETLEELNGNPREVIAMILDEGAPATEGEFVGTQIIVVA